MLSPGTNASKVVPMTQKRPPSPGAPVFPPGPVLLAVHHARKATLSCQGGLAVLRFSAFKLSGLLEPLGIRFAYEFHELFA